MKGEFLSLDTTKKLANREKAIKYCQNILKREKSVQVKMYVENIKRILEGKDGEVKHS